MNKQKIVTPCPSCGGKTLFVGAGGHLTCSWVECKEPVVETAIAQLKEALSNLMKDYARRIRMGAMLKPYLQARRLMEKNETHQAI